MKALVCLWAGILLLSSKLLWAQCPTASFNLQSSACLQESLFLDNTSTGAESYEWLFCSTDYKVAPSFAKQITTIEGTPVGPVFYSKILNLNGETYLYFIGNSSNKLFGVKIIDLEAFAFEEYTVIDLSSIITNAGGFDIINENGNWYGLITRTTSPFSLIKISLSADLKSISAFTDISSGLTLATTFDVKIRKSNGNYFAFIANQTAPLAEQILRLSFGASLANTPIPSYIPMPSVATSASLDFYENCGTWTSFVTSRNGKMFRIDFDSDLGSAATATELTLGLTLNDPGGLALIREHDHFIALVSSRNGFYYSVDFGSLITNNSPTTTAIGNFKSTSRDWDLEVLRVGNQYKIVSSNFTGGSNGGLYFLSYPITCNASLSYSQNTNEEIMFAENGVKKITLVAMGAGDQESYATKEISISTLVAPQLTINSVDVWCLNSTTQFQFTSDVEITSQQWTFGDGNQSIDEFATTHYITTGTFTVELDVVASNSCHNVERRDIKIYPPPSPSFTLPTGLICTNNEFTFTNTTTDNFEGNLSFQWLVDDVPVGTQRDFLYTFPTGGDKKITLQTTIPGCSSEAIQTIAGVGEGPVVDFTVDGICLDETVQLANASQGDIASYFWNFGDGQTSTEPSPVTTYASAGTYALSLETFGTNGCVSTKTINHQIFSAPQPNFTLDLPPFSCSGSPSQFRDATPVPDDSNLQEWTWNFEGDETTDGKNPTHIFQEAGDYNVSLTVTTDQGCSATVVQPVTILQSPVADFEFDPLCVNQVARFREANGGNLKTWAWQIANSTYTVQEPTHVFLFPGTFNASLMVTAQNDCIAQSAQTVTVPEVPTLDFDAAGLCANGETTLSSLVESESDPVVEVRWAFDDQEIAGSVVAYNFTTQGTLPVSMVVKNESGCVYQLVKNITINPRPTASFIVSAIEGAAPLEVAFTNTSTGANQFQWLANNQQVSTTANLNQTFSEVGGYVVDLVAVSPEGCTNTFSQQINVIIPRTELALAQFQLLTDEATGALRSQLQVTNNSNYTVREFAVNVDLGNGTRFRETVNANLAPGTTSSILLSQSLLGVSSGYVCVELVAENDELTFNNAQCTSLQEEPVLFTPYPNPTTDYVQFDVVAKSQGVITMQMVGSTGNVVAWREATVQPGLNQFRWDIREVNAGLYILILETGSQRILRRLVVREK